MLTRVTENPILSITEMKVFLDEALCRKALNKPHKKRCNCNLYGAFISIRNVWNTHCLCKLCCPCTNLAGKGNLHSSAWINPGFFACTPTKCSIMLVRWLDHLTGTDSH